MRFLHRLPPIAGLLAALTLALAGCGGTASHGAAVANRAGLISIFEADELLTSPAQTLDQLRRLGVQYVRVMVDWRSVAPDSSSPVAPAHFDASSPAAYPATGWAPYDALVRDSQLRHIGVMFDVTGGAPDWATGPGFTPGGLAGVWKPSAAAFGAFVRAIGERYSGSYTPPGASTPLPRVGFWSIWNEPNLGEADLAPQAIDNSKVEVSPTLYRGLLDAGWAGLHESGHGGDTILIGELAPYGEQAPPSPIYPQGLPGIFGYMLPLRFLRALYCVDSSLRPLRGAAAAARGCPTTAGAGSRNFVRQHPALFDATGFAMHPYPSGGVAPDKILPVDDPDYVYLATLSRLTRFLDRVTARYGAPRRYPIYSTEYGYLTDPPYAGGAPVQVAAAYLNRAEYISWRNPRLRSWDQYQLVDPPPFIESRSYFDTGLEFTDGRQKATYAAYRMPIYLPATAQHGHGLEVWGCVRPAYYAPQPRRVAIQLQRDGRGPFKTVRLVTLPSSSCYFDVTVRFASGGNVRLAWSYESGPTIYSRLVTITAG